MQRSRRAEKLESDILKSAELSLPRLLAAGDITRIELAAGSGVNLRAIKALCDHDEAVYRLPVSTVLRISLALGCACVELMPELGRRAKTGLLYERGVLTRRSL
jgi:hypothetical protein